MSLRSPAESSTVTDPRFSSSLCRFVVPGICTIHGFCASSQASATWAGVARLRAATVPISSTSARFALRAAGANQWLRAGRSGAGELVIFEHSIGLGIRRRLHFDLSNVRKCSRRFVPS